MEPLQIQDMFSLSGSQGARFQVSVTNGSVVVLPLGPSTNAQTSLSATPLSSDQTRYTQSNIDHPLLNGADESLTDLQPEDSESEDESGDNERDSLTPEQQKVEYMASLGLVPPAVLEEIQRRQELCRVEYGNWWDRLHSTDFCLVPKNESLFANIHNLEDNEQSISDYPIIPAEDQSQVAAGPDAGSLVEQITYLTSWPQSNNIERQEVVEINQNSYH